MVARAQSLRDSLRVHSDRVAGRHRHHCYPGGDAAARSGQRQSEGEKDQCISNLHQNYVGCAMYSGDYSDWYPIWIDLPGGHALNKLNGEHYTRYVVGPQASAANVTVPENYTAPGFQFNNLGYLYAGKYIGNGHVMYCPSFPQKSPVGQFE